MDAFTAIVSLGICIALPVVIVSLVLKHKSEVEKNRKEIIMQILEKNNDADIKSIVEKLNAPDKLIKEKLLEKMQKGLMLTLVGVGIVIISYAFLLNYQFRFFMIIGGVFASAIGVSNIVSYRLGKKLLEKEIEAQEKDLQKEL